MTQPTIELGPHEERLQLFIDACKRLQLLIDACKGLQNDRLRYFIDKGGIGKFIESLVTDSRATASDEQVAKLREFAVDYRNLLAAIAALPLTDNDSYVTQLKERIAKIDAALASETATAEAPNPKER